MHIAQLTNFGGRVSVRLYASAPAATHKFASASIRGIRKACSDASASAHLWRVHTKIRLAG